MIFFLFNDAESLMWTHHDIHVAEILLELALNTTQSINIIVNVLVNFVNSSMRKLKTYDHGVQESDCAVNSCTRIFPYIFHIKPGFFRGVVVVVIVW
jgi:hypothetical protein